MQSFQNSGVKSSAILLSQNNDKTARIVKTLFRTLENAQRLTRRLYSTSTTELGVRTVEAAFELGAVPIPHHPPLPSMQLFYLGWARHERQHFCCFRELTWFGEKCGKAPCPQALSKRTASSLAKIRGGQYHSCV